MTFNKRVPQRKTTKRFAVITLAFLSLVVMSACGSSNSSASSGGDTSNISGASTTAKGTPIKIGVLCSCSGTLGVYAIASGDVMHAWAKNTNATGGIDGHPIDLIFFNDDSNPGNSVTDAATLVSDHVAAVVDLSLLDTAWASTFDKANIPVIGGVEQSSPYLTDPNFYSSAQTEDSFVYAVVDLAKQAGATTIGTLVCLESTACSRQIPIVKTDAQQLGLRQTYSSAVSATSPNYTAQCVAAQQAKAQALFVSVGPTTAASVAANCSQQGYDPIYLAGSSSYKSSMNTAPGTSKNMWVEFQNLPYFSTAPEVKTFDAVVDKYYPGLRQGNGNVVWSESAAIAWVNGLLVHDAVVHSGVGASGTVTAAAVTQGLHSLRGDTLGGWASPLTFTAGKATPVDCWFSAKIVNGVPTILNNGQATCHTPTSTS